MYLNCKNKRFKQHLFCHHPTLYFLSTISPGMPPLSSCDKRYSIHIGNCEGRQTIMRLWHTQSWKISGIILSWHAPHAKPPVHQTQRLSAQVMITTVLHTWGPLWVRACGFFSPTQAAHWFIYMGPTQAPCGLTHAVEAIVATLWVYCKVPVVKLDPCGSAVWAISRDLVNEEQLCQQHTFRIIFNIK